MQMRYPFISLLFVSLFFVACNQPEPQPKDPAETVYYTEHDSVIANPERGIYVQAGYHTNDMSKQTQAATLLNVRKNQQITLYLHMYYLEDFCDKPVSQECLDRFEANMLALREGGAKAIIRFAYSDGYDPKDKPWDATPEIVATHINQFAPLMQKYADVILCVQAGFIGSWGEWYYTENFVFNPSTDEQFQLRRELIDHLLEAVPVSRQIALRTPEYKIKYLRTTYEDFMTEDEAFGPSARARLAAHNDCFLSSSNDVGTFSGPASREYWKNESKYTFMGGESCAFLSALANGEYALTQLSDYHWDYLHRDYYREVLTYWKTTGYYDEIANRLGYRFVMDKAYWTQEPKAGATFTLDFTVRNVGFSCPKNERPIELVFVNTANANDKFVYPQALDARMWQGGDTISSRLVATLDSKMSGEYNIYINLPDPYDAIHDNPLFSIRFANVNMWEEATGYNKLGTVIIN